MPTSTDWVMPDVFMTHNNVTVYRTYKDGDVGQGANTHYFTTDCYSDDHSFDVREVDVPSKELLNNHPPYLAADVNPEFATATGEQKAEWRRQWDEWHEDGGGEEQAIATIIKEAIDLGLIKAPEYEDGPVCSEPTASITDAQKLAGFNLAGLFMQELLESVETLSGIAEQHGPRTLADLMYLHSAIMNSGFIDHYQDESAVLGIARGLPSGEQWAKYITVEYMDSPAA